MDATIFHRMAARLGRERMPGAKPPDLEAERVPRTGAAASSTARQHQRPTAHIPKCEVCGRTLLDGERAQEIRIDDTVLAACALCVIKYQTGRDRHAA
jgi:hypothetical protein